MDSKVIKRGRQLTGSFATLWALLAIALSVYTLASPRSGPQLPVQTSIIAGVAVVHGMGESAAEAGVEIGDHLVSIDGVPVIQVLWKSTLNAGVIGEYQFQKPDGSLLVASLIPATGEEVEKSRDSLINLSLLLVSSLYLVVALVVWWTRQASAEAWA
ncbi:MAG: hypothetical protein ABGX04_16130, partial [Myxococcales bacterium]